MRRAERILNVGRLVMRGPSVHFEPSDHSLDADVGDDVELVVTFDYEEASTKKESCKLVVSAEVQGRSMGEEEVRFRDRPVLPDGMRGSVSFPFRVDARGDIAGRYKLKAYYVETAWMSEEGARRSEFHHEGAFVVRVR